MSSNRGRSRPQLTNETFTRPPSRGYNSRPASRTTSASPGPLRRRQPSDLEQPPQTSRLHNLPSSTHSTPAKKPMKRSDSRSSRSEMISATASAAKSQKTLADLDLEEEVQFFTIRVFKKLLRLFFKETLHILVFHSFTINTTYNI